MNNCFKKMLIGALASFLIGNSYATDTENAVSITNKNKDGGFTFTVDISDVSLHCYLFAVQYPNVISQVIAIEKHRSGTVKVNAPNTQVNISLRCQETNGAALIPDNFPIATNTTMYIDRGGKIRLES